MLPAPSNTILEKPKNIIDQIGMLQDYSGLSIQVITAVTLVQPQIAIPGYSLASLVTGTSFVVVRKGQRVSFLDSDLSLRPFPRPAPLTARP